MYIIPYMLGGCINCGNFCTSVFVQYGNAKENVQNNPYIIGCYCESGISVVMYSRSAKNGREAQL